MDFLDILSSATALFLDFDGTLVDIADQPHDVQVPHGLVQTLGSLNDSLGGAVAVISGRPISQIDDFLRPLKLAAAGVHGAERRSASGELTLLHAPALHVVEHAARKLAASNAGLLVESKRGSLALHYRQAPELEALCLSTMQDAVRESSGLTLLQGKMVVEAKPSGATKGGAIEQFLGEPPFAGRVPLFVGDDITDEAGFASVQRLGGMGVKVGDGPTVARQRIATPQLFRQQLQDAVVARTAKAVSQ